MDRRSLTFARALALALTSALVGFAVWACGDEDEGAEGEKAPQILEVIPECGPSTDPQRYEGQVLARIEVTVSDPDGDAEFITIAMGGTLFRVDESEGEEGAVERVFTYVVPDDESLLRCEAGTVILIRAVDSAGHVTEQEAELL